MTNSDNILLEYKDDLQSLRMSDFGLAVKAGLDKQYSLTLKCGTPAYMAPEMYLEGMYSKSIDMWSIGIILYRLLNKGQCPFFPDELKELAKNPDHNIEGKFKNIICTDNCMHLLRRLLEPQALKRYQSYMAAIHPFITGELKMPSWTIREQEAMSEITSDLRKVHTYLQKVNIFLVLLNHLRKNIKPASKPSTSQQGKLSSVSSSPLQNFLPKGSRLAVPRDFRITGIANNGQTPKKSKYSYKSDRFSRDQNDSGSDYQRIATSGKASAGSVQSKEENTAEEQRIKINIQLKSPVMAFRTSTKGGLPEPETHVKGVQPFDAVEENIDLTKSNGQSMKRSSTCSKNLKNNPRGIGTLLPPKPSRLPKLDHPRKISGFGRQTNKAPLVTSTK